MHLKPDEHTRHKLVSLETATRPGDPVETKKAPAKNQSSESHLSLTIHFPGSSLPSEGTPSQSPKPLELQTAMIEPTASDEEATDCAAEE